MDRRPLQTRRMRRHFFFAAWMLFLLCRYTAIVPELSQKIHHLKEKSANPDPGGASASHAFSSKLLSRGLETPSSCPALRDIPKCRVLRQQLGYHTTKESSSAVLIHDIKQKCRLDDYMYTVHTLPGNFTKHQVQTPLSATRAWR